jgi:hypothetical protein
MGPQALEDWLITVHVLIAVVAVGTAVARVERPRHRPRKRLPAVDVDGQAQFENHPDHYWITSAMARSVPTGDLRAAVVVSRVTVRPVVRLLSLFVLRKRGA